MSKSILVTGGAGFIAHHVIEYILDNTDWTIVSLDRLDFSGNLNRFNDNGSAHSVGNGNGGNQRTSTLAEFIFLDGQYEDYTSFGESKNGVWIPKDPSGLTFGNNGFHLKFQNSAALGDDSSGNNNDFTATGLGADHQLTDSPTNGEGS